MNRFKLLILTSFVIAVTALSPGISITYAEQGPTAAIKTDIKDPAAAKLKADAAARALAKRADMLKQRKEARDYIRKVVEGQQAVRAAPVPDNAGTGGAQ